MVSEKVAVSVSKNLILEKNIGFGEIRYRKKVAVSVSKNLILEKNIGIGFGQNIGIVIQ